GVGVLDRGLLEHDAARDLAVAHEFRGVEQPRASDLVSEGGRNRGQRRRTSEDGEQALHASLHTSSGGPSTRTGFSGACVSNFGNSFGLGSASIASIAAFARTRMSSGTVTSCFISRRAS